MNILGKVISTPPQREVVGYDDGDSFWENWYSLTRIEV